MSIRYVYEKWNSVTQSKYEGFSESLVTTFTGTYTTDIPSSRSLYYASGTFSVTETSGSIYGGTSHNSSFSETDSIYVCFRWYYRQ